MVFYRLLSASDLPSLYDCFLEAFSDYQVDMRMSREQFDQRIARDGVQLEISAGDMMISGSKTIQVEVKE